jgi:hypothetical protein
MGEIETLNFVLIQNDFLNVVLREDNHSTNYGKHAPLEAAKT